MKYTTMDRVFLELKRDYPIKEFDPSNIIEWTGRALGLINARKAREEAVSFHVVRNYQCELPIGLHSIIQVAKNTRVDSFEPQITEEVTVDTSQSATIPVFLDANGVPYPGYGVEYFRPYYDMIYGYKEWTTNDIYERNYIPVRLSNHSFFNTVVCRENNTGIYAGTKFEYSLIENKVMRFNFEKGLVAIAYNRTPLDENGFPKIPDDESFIEAIISYIVKKDAFIDFHSGIQGAGRRFKQAESDWHWYCKQAQNKTRIPKGIDEMENLLNQESYILPRRSAYDNYFGNLNNREVKNLLDTNYRNNIGSIEL